MKQRDKLCDFVSLIPGYISHTVGIWCPNSVWVPNCVTKLQFRNANPHQMGNILILLAAIFMTACTPPSNEPLQTAPLLPPVETLSPEIWLDWPLDGSEHPLEDILEVQAYAHDPNSGGIKEMQLFINGDLTHIITSPNPHFVVNMLKSWQPEQPGNYVIEVRAINTAGLSGQPAVAHIVIGKKEAPPISMTFASDKTSLKLGECVTLQWAVANAETIKLNGRDVPAEGSERVCPQQSSTYQLIATVPEGEPAEQEVALAVLPTPQPPPGVEITFEADQSNYQKFGDCITLQWAVKNAQSVRLDETSVGLQGNQQKCPTAPSNVYNLTAKSLSGETIKRTIIINIPATPTPQPLAPAINFIADQFTINQGSCTTLRWTVSNAHTMRLDGTAVAGQGSQRVCPTASVKAYTLVATGGGGTLQKTVTIKVVQPQPTPQPTPQPLPTPLPTSQPLPNKQISFRADHTSLNCGQCTTLRWDVEGVREVYVDGSGVTGHGSKQICPSSSTTYNLHAILTNGASEDRSVHMAVSGHCGSDNSNSNSSDYQPTDLKPSVKYDLYVRRMDFSPASIVAEQTVNLTIMIATDSYPSGGPYFPASTFRWQPGDGSGWRTESCSASTQQASCTKNVQFIYVHSGFYTVEVQADPSNFVSESNESNNSKTWTVTAGIIVQ